MITDHAGLTPFERMLSLVTRMRPGEGKAAFLFFTHGFLLLSSYQVVKALREAFMLAKFSAETRSYAVALTALTLMFVVPFYGWVRRHLDGARLLRAVTLFFVVTMPMFAFLGQSGVSIAFPFFIWVSIYGLMVVSQMWAYAADSFNVKSGQRLFVVIMLGANLGALTGAKVAQLAAEALSPMGLMVLAAGLLATTLFLAGPERKAVPEGSQAVSVEHTRPVPKLLGGIGLVLRDKYLLQIAVLLILLNWVNSNGEFILADFIKAEAQSRLAASGGLLDLGSIITSLYGQFNFWVTLASFSIQLFLVSRIFRVMGVRGALLIHPAIVAIAYGVLALAPVLGGFLPIFTLVRLIKVIENGIDYSLMNTTRQALFLPVDRDSKYDGKTAIDTFFYRFGDLIQALVLFFGLNYLDWTSTQFAVLNLVLALCWLALAVAIGRGYSQKALDNVMNVAPEVAEPIPDLLYQPGRTFMHRVSPTAFLDADPGDVLTLRACCEDGSPLPRWMRFDDRQRAFVGSVPAGVTIEELRIVVIASDVDGMEARSTFVVRSVGVVG